MSTELPNRRKEDTQKRQQPPLLSQTAALSNEKISSTALAETPK
jgi:hypothetical protein